MTHHTPLAGRFVWHDLMALDADRGRDFYTHLIGWRTKEMDSPGGQVTIFSAGDEDVADVMALDAAHGTPSHWTCYITVDDLDATVARAQALGAQIVVPVTEIPPWGRMAGIVDPAGAYFQAFQPSPSGEGEASGGWESPWPPRHGTFAWFELMTADPVGIAPFYESLFGWSTEAGMDLGEMGTYWMFKRGEENRAGLMGLPPQVPVANWLPYIAVDDLAGTVDQVAALGGTVVMEPTHIPGTGHVATIQDSVGAVVALFQAEPVA